MLSRNRILWLIRIAWSSLPFALGEPLASIGLGHQHGVGVMLGVGGWVIWTIGLIALLVPFLATLTIIRMLAPVPLAASLAAVVSADDSGSVESVIVATLVSFIILIGVFSSEIGHEYTQASAYGDERRYPLRIPAPLLILIPIGWLLTVATTVTGLLASAAGRPLVGIPLSIVGAALTTGFARRCHRISRRFAVFVPAGFALHDHLALADTAMFRRTEIDTLSLAARSTDALDLTAGALGPAVELTLREMGMVVRAGTMQSRQGVSVHVRSLMFSPSRPGRLLAEAARRQLAAMPPPSTN